MAGTLEKISDQELAPRNLSGFSSLLKRLAAFCNALLNFKIVTNSGRNFFSITEGNAVLELNIAAVVNDVVASPDFTLYDASDSTGTKIGITPGTVNPTCGLTFQGATALPSVFSGGNDYVFAVSGNGTAYLQVTTNQPTNATAPQMTGNTVASGASVPAFSPTVGYQALGTWQVSGGKVQILTGAVGIGSQNVLCAGGVYFWAA